MGSSTSRGRRKNRKARRHLPPANPTWDGGLSAGSRPFWERINGITRSPGNLAAWDRFSLFAMFAVVTVAALFGGLVLVAWITS